MQNHPLLACYKSLTNNASYACGRLLMKQLAFITVD